MSSLHQVSPQMRERYGVGRNGGSERGRRQTRFDDWDDYDGIAWDDGRGSGPRYNDPSVDSYDRRYSPGFSQRGPGGFNLPFGLPFWIAVGLAIVLLIVVIVVAMNSCSSTQQDQAAQQQQLQDQQAGESQAGQADGSSSSSEASGASSSSSDGEIDKAALVKILDEDLANKLIYRAETNEDAKWIATHPDQYAKEGPVIQRKLLKLAADEPAAITYVRYYPEKYPMDKPQDGSIKTIVTGRGIPRLYQWDQIWGYTKYSGTGFGLTGCAPTALSMVYQGLTGSTDLSPYDMAELAERDGYMTDDEGTLSTFFTEEAKTLGLNATTIDTTEEALKKAIESGQCVIANFEPGSIFTETGHYVVITGRSNDGALVINDPYSEERSNRTWDYNTIVSASMGFYAYG